MLEYVLAKQEVDVPGARTEGWRVGQRLASNGDPRVVSKGVCQDLGARTLGLDKQQSGNAGVCQEALTESADASAYLRDLTANEWQPLLVHPIAQPSGRAQILEV